MKIVYRPAAVEDIREIFFSSVERWGVEQADHYLDQIHDNVGSLLEQPRRGTVFEAFRFIPSGMHFVFYEIHKDTISVVRVLHKRMNVKARLSDEDSGDPNG